MATAIREAVYEILPDMVDFEDNPYPKTRVNWGWCEDVAKSAQERLKRMGVRSIVVRDDDELRHSDHEIYTDDAWTHAWIWVEGRHHDAEALRGVKRWLELPHFKRWLGPWKDEGLKEDMETLWPDGPPAPVVITPNLPQGEEQALFYRSAKAVEEVMALLEARL